MLIEDLSLFFNSNEFAVEALFKNQKIIKGIFGNAYVEINQVESQRPTFTCIHNEVSSVQHNDNLVIENTSYKVVGVKPDGTGVVTLILELQ